MKSRREIFGLAASGVPLAALALAGGQAFAGRRPKERILVDDPALTALPSGAGAIERSPLPAWLHVKLNPGHNFATRAQMSRLSEKLAGAHADPGLAGKAVRAILVEATRLVSHPRVRELGIWPFYRTLDVDYDGRWAAGELSHWDAPARAALPTAADDVEMALAELARDKQMVEDGLRDEALRMPLWNRSAWYRHNFASGPELLRAAVKQSLIDDGHPGAAAVFI